MVSAEPGIDGYQDIDISVLSHIDVPRQDFSLGELCNAPGCEHCWLSFDVSECIQVQPSQRCVRLPDFKPLELHRLGHVVPVLSASEYHNRFGHLLSTHAGTNTDAASLEAKDNFDCDI